uniref:C2H2-type domain-containing protein n=1 Tax=Glossina morsitans morsitans TaxID=37546 RepID=A0A1B0G4Z4_GLOMM
METHAVDYPFYEYYGNMSNTYTDYAWLIGGHANARAEPVQQYDSTSALTAVTPVQSDAQNPQIVGYTERRGTDQRPCHPSDLGSTLMPLNNQSLATDTSHVVSWSPDSLMQLASEQHVAVDSGQSQQRDAYPTSTEGSLEGCNIVEGGLYNPGSNDFSNADIISAAFLPEVEGTAAAVDCIKLPDGAFQCLKCDKVCSKIYGLKQHMDVAHSGERLYRCAPCGKRFVTRESLERHSLRHAPSGKAFKCQECPKDYHRKSDLNRHIKEKHTGAPLGCHLCTRRYSRKDHLLKHINTHLNPKRRGKPAQSRS